MIVSLHSAVFGAACLGLVLNRTGALVPRVTQRVLFGWFDYTLKMSRTALILVAPILWTSCTSPNERSRSDLDRSPSSPPAPAVIAHGRSADLEEPPYQIDPRFAGQVLDRIRDGIATVWALDSAAEEGSQGTAFRVNRCLFVTAAHVVEGASVIQLTRAGLAQVESARVVSVDEQGDLALLSVTELEEHVTELTIADSSPRAGEPVVLIGSPGGLEDTIQVGYVAALRESGGSSSLQLSFSSRPGASGAPVLNEMGEVVGVATSIREDVGDTAFAVDASKLTKLIELHRSHEGRQFDTDSRPAVGQGLAAFGLQTTAVLLEDLGVSIQLPTGWTVIHSDGDSARALDGASFNHVRMITIESWPREPFDPWQAGHEAFLEDFRSALEPGQQFELRDLSDGFCGSAPATQFDGTLSQSGLRMRVVGRSFFHNGKGVNAAAAISEVDSNFASELNLVEASLATLRPLADVDSALARDSAHVTADDSLKASAHRAANDMLDAAMNSDLPRFLSFIPDFMRDQLSQADLAGAARLLRANTFEIARPTTLVQDGDLVVTTCRSVEETGIGDDGSRIRTTGWLLVASEDGGQSWFVLQGSHDVKSYVRDFVGLAAASLDMPDRHRWTLDSLGEPTWEWIESNSEMVLSEESRKKLQTLLDDR